MTVKTRLVALEQIHAATTKRAAVEFTSTPATRARAAAELETWRATMTDDEGVLATMCEHTAFFVEHGHHRRPV